MLEEYKITVKNKYQALQETIEQTTVENCWEGIKETFNTSCHEIFGVKKYHHKEWITNDTLKKVMAIEKKDKKAKVNSSRTRADKKQKHKKNMQRPIR